MWQLVTVVQTPCDVSTVPVVYNVSGSVLCFKSLLYKQHATAVLHESIHTSRYLGAFTLGCTHTHMQHTHTGWLSDEISFCHLACCAADVSPLPKHQQLPPQLHPHLAFPPPRLHAIDDKPHALDMEGAGHHFINDPKILTLSFLLCFPAFTVFLVFALFHAHTHTEPVGSWDHDTDRLCGWHVDGNGELPLKLSLPLLNLQWNWQTNNQPNLCFIYLKYALKKTLYTAVALAPMKRYYLSFSPLNISLSNKSYQITFFGMCDIEL